MTLQNDTDTTPTGVHNIETILANLRETAKNLAEADAIVRRRG